LADSLHLIVEGFTEETAVPLLIRRFLHEHYQRFEFTYFSTHNSRGRGEITVQGGLEKTLNRIRLTQNHAGVIVLLDAEKESVACPPVLALNLASRAQALNLPFPVVIICAACEFESWFLYNIANIAPKYLKPDAYYEDDPEQECDAKGWLSRHMREGRIYKGTQLAPGMTKLIDLPHTIQRSRSFRRLDHAVTQLLAAIDSSENSVTPI
jgi:Domain of unknown function (DUF4276)